MKDKEAIELLKRSLDQIDSLKKSYKLSGEHTKWLSDTLYLVEEIFGKNSRIYINLALLTWQNKGNFRLTMHPEKELEYQNHQGYLSDLEIAHGLIESGIDLIKRRGMDAVSSSSISTISGSIQQSFDKLRETFNVNQKTIANSLHIDQNLEYLKKIADNMEKSVKLAEEQRFEAIQQRKEAIKNSKRDRKRFYISLVITIVLGVLALVVGIMAL